MGVFTLAVLGLGALGSMGSDIGYYPMGGHMGAGHMDAGFADEDCPGAGEGEYHCGEYGEHEECLEGEECEEHEEYGECEEERGECCEEEYERGEESEERQNGGGGCWRD